MNTTLKRYWTNLRRATIKWLDHDGFRLAASLSLYSLLSLAPLVTLSIALASFVFGHSTAEKAIIDEAGRIAGADGAATIRMILEHAQSGRPRGAATAIGLVILLVGASSVFGELQSGLNTVWNAQSPQAGFWSVVKSRLISFALVLAFIFLFVASLIFSAAVTAFDSYVGSYFSLSHGLLVASDAVISFVAICLLIGLILRYVPDARLGWLDVWQGAVVTAVLFTVGKMLLGLYLGRTAIASAYGAAGSLVVAVLWVYYFAMIFYFGAEFTYSCARAASLPRPA